MNWLAVINGVAMGAIYSLNRIYYRQSKRELMEVTLELRRLILEVESKSIESSHQLGNEITELDEDYKITKTQLRDQIEQVRRNLPSIDC